jgi:trimeric autotransporter adhesin
MQRYLTLLVLFLLTVPVGLSIQGCANKNSSYCNGSGYGYLKTQPVSITLGPQATGVSLGYGQQGQLTAPAATTCTGSAASGVTYNYGSTDLTIADVSPTGAVCAGTWNRNTPGVASFTTCLPTNKQGIAYMTAEANGFSSNQVAVYSHPPITSLTVQGPTGPNGVPMCLSQNQTTQLQATAYCVSTGPASSTTTTPGVCPSATVAAGQQVQLCGQATSSNPSLPACSSVIGNITYAASNATVVSINNATGVATAQQPGSTLINGSIANTGATSGYFYTCPPKSISLSVPVTGATSVTVTPNNPQPLTATVTDTNDNLITGLALTYVSTNPGSIAVSTAGSVTASFPSTSAITAVCEPGTCNPAPINLIGSVGTGAPIVSNSVQVTSPGQNSTFIWMSNPSSPYFVPMDLSTGTVGTAIKLPYTPNSMVLDQGGDTLYFGSYRELMIYSAATNTLTTEDTTVPGVVLAVSPSNNAVIINDRNRGVIYLYTPAAAASTGSTGTTATPATAISIAGIGEKAAFSPDGQTAYIVGTNVLYVYNTFTGWSTESLPTGQASATTGVCPVVDSTSYPANPNTTPPNSPTNPNNSYNFFCSPDLAVTVPSAAVFLSGSPTAAYGICPNTTVTPFVPYPESTSVNASTDHVAATTDGKHIIGATANPLMLTDISITVPIDACPLNPATQQTMGSTFTPTPVVSQTSLSAYTNGLTNVNQVIASTNSQETFVTYTSSATTPPTGGALLPVYEPAAQAGTLGTLTGIKLAGSAVAPVSGIFSPDNTTFFVGTTGDNELHLINTQTLVDTQQINPKLVDANGNPLPPVFLAVKPRPTT